MRNTKQKRLGFRLLQLERRDVPATLPTGFVEAQITGALSSATAMEFAPDGKLFVLEQAGTLEVYQGSGNSWTQVAPSNNFFTGNTLVLNSSGERGLLGIAFDPNYLSNRFVYVYYTATTPAIHNRISRFTANAAGTQVVAGSEAVLMDLDNLSSATNHNGGAMHFGPDGKLYVAVGENANPANSQVITNRLGKMLRLNPDPANPIPADNPTSIAGIAGTTTGLNRAIWAAGLRNPFTFSFHPTSGLMHINDVGQNAWEEVNIGTAGANYGWSTTEGRFSPASFPNFTNPIVAYRHLVSNGTNYPPGNDYEGFAITGGVFYVSSAYPFPQDYVGDYFFADYVSDWIRKYDATTNSVQNFATNALGTVDLKVGTDGCLYYLARDAGGSAVGRVLRVNFTGSTSPYIVAHPGNQTVSEGQPVTFTVQAGGPGLTYQWQRNNVDIPGATSASYTIPMAPLTDNNASFRVIVTNSTSSVTSNSATLSVTPNQPPVPNIITPIVGTHFNYGDNIVFSGSATDPEETTITNPARYTWWVTYHTGGIERPFISEFSGVTSGNFNLPTISPYTLPDVIYRIHLRVADGLGITGETFRDLLPNTAQVTLSTSPAGAPLLLDGTPQTTPYVFTGVTGQQRSLGAPVTATVGGFAFTFVSWSDAGAIVHDISTPIADTTFTANYVQRPARVAEFRVDDGTAQRSMVRSLQVTFDAVLNPVALLNDAFTLTGPMGLVPFMAGPIDNSSGRSVVLITFVGPGLDNGSLPQGIYNFSVLGGQLVDGMSTALDGDANGSPGGNYVAQFHRLQGDADGDGTVGAADFSAFRLAYGTSVGGNGYLSYFDADGDGVISAFDFNRFRLTYGQTI